MVDLAENLTVERNADTNNSEGAGHNSGAANNSEGAAQNSDAANNMEGAAHNSDGDHYLEDDAQDSVDYGEYLGGDKDYSEGDDKYSYNDMAEDKADNVNSEGGINS